MYNVILFYHLDGALGQSVNQSALMLSVREEESVTLPCSYKDVSNPNLFWYIQGPNLPPELIYNGLLAGNVPASFENRLAATHNSKERTFNVQISGVRLSDSSVYYCALNPTALQRVTLVRQQPCRFLPMELRCL
ncbi:TVA3 protein, partial [Amia calva]|nr:TVA3 protein [Amia calva]MBN3300710.1 TVA3 protein [Amia calva]